MPWGSLSGIQDGQKEKRLQTIILCVPTTEVIYIYLIHTPLKLCFQAVFSNLETLFHNDANDKSKEQNCTTRKKLCIKRIYIYIYIYIYTHTHTHTNIQKHTHAYIYIYTHNNYYILKYLNKS